MSRGTVKRYLFPFGNVALGEKIVLYGAGAVCREYIAQIGVTKYCKCIAIVDKNYKKIKSVNGIPVVEPSCINNIIYDKIVIASTTYVDEIYAQLQSMGVSSEVIVKESHVVKQQIEPKHVYIDDYVYNPKHRSSLASSKINDILSDWYVESKEEVFLLMNKFYKYERNYEKIPFDTNLENTPRWNNSFVHPLDAINIYGFLAIKNPRFYVEVGSGNTTLFAKQSINDNNLRTKIISIDPFPRASINELCYKIYRNPLEEMDISFFEQLTSEDILLIDNSHRSFPNSDVTVFFTEILPKLPSGLLYTMHDIFLPFDYSDVWSTTQKRWYNEQYLLCAYLLGGGGGDKIVFPAKFLGHQKDFIETCEPMRGEGKLFHKKTFSGGFFWLEKS